MNYIAHVEPEKISPAQTQSRCRTQALTKLLKSVVNTDADVLFPVMARLLHLHIEHDHQDYSANTRIRQSLDELELVLSLDIERLRLRSTREKTPYSDSLKR